MDVGAAAIDYRPETPCRFLAHVQASHHLPALEVKPDQACLPECAHNLCVQTFVPCQAQVHDETWKLTAIQQNCTLDPSEQHFLFRLTQAFTAMLAHPRRRIAWHTLVPRKREDSTVVASEPAWGGFGIAGKQF